MDIPDIEYTTESTHIVHSDGIAVEYTTESTYIFRSGCVCQSIGFTCNTYLPLWWYTSQSDSPATHIFHFDGMSVKQIHSPSDPSCLAPCLWSPGLAHSHTPSDLSIHCACACGNGIDTYLPL